MLLKRFLADGRELVEPAFWMAPMAGITDAAFRARLRRNGCRRLCTEMVSASALARGNAKTLKEINVPDLDPELSVQIFGSDPEDLAEAAYRAQEVGFGHVDFNMGCPARKVVRGGGGAALLTDLGRSERCLRSLRRAVRGTLSVKLRSGWDAKSVNCLEVGRLAVECGADLLTLHPRTRAEGYSGSANWDLVDSLARAVAAPVIGNGDIGSAQAAVDKLRTTSCSGVMIGRGALGRPWVFREAQSWLREGRPGRPPTPAEVHRDLLLQLSDVIRWKGVRVAVLEMRKFVAWAASGSRGAAELRRRLQWANDEASLRDEMDRFFGESADSGDVPDADRREMRGRAVGFP